MPFESLRRGSRPSLIRCLLSDSETLGQHSKYPRDLGCIGKDSMDSLDVGRW